MTITETTIASNSAFLVPEVMRSARRWILWRTGYKDGKEVKKPVFPYNATKPETWLTLEQASHEQAKRQSYRLGFVLGDGFVGIDLDKCIAEDGTLSEAARNLVLLGTYVERSPSGYGLHAIICGTIARNHKNPGFEIYDGREGSARWFTFTGDCVGDVQEIASGDDAQARLDAYYGKWFARNPQAGPKAFSDEQVIQLCRSFNKTGQVFQELWNGGLGTSASPSQADFAFVRLLRFVTRDSAQLDRLFRQSGRMRNKWDELRPGGTYGSETIAKALAGGGKVYHPSKVVTTSSRTQQARVMPWWFQRLPTYGGIVFKVLVYLAAHADENGKCFPAKATIARDLRISESSVDNAIGTLVGFKILRKAQRYCDSNMYTLIYDLKPGEDIYLPDDEKPLKPKYRKSKKYTTGRVFSKC